MSALSNSPLNKPPVQGAPPVGSSRNHYASEAENEFRLGHLTLAGVLLNGPLNVIIAHLTHQALSVQVPLS